MCTGESGGGGYVLYSLQGKGGGGGVLTLC